MSVTQDYKNHIENLLAALTCTDVIASAETTRWHLWECVSLTDRQRAVGVAGLSKDRASAPLASFSDAERAAVRAALSAHMGRMEFIAQIMAASNTARNGYLH